MNNAALLLQIISRLIDNKNNRWTYLMSTTGWSELVQICQIIFKLIQNTVLLSRIKLRETDQQHWQQLLSCHDLKKELQHM